MGISQDGMDEAERLFCLPMVLLINFALFPYLMTVYIKRRREIRVKLLFFFAFLGFAVMVPLAHPRGETVGHLNDISETCSILTFLLQIIIIGRDIARRVRIWSLKMLTHLAELLSLFGLLVVMLNFIEVAKPSVDISRFNGLDNIFENIGLAFMFVFRFYYMAISRGLKWLFTEKKLEIGLYLLFVTHEYPFLALARATGVSWDPVQAIWHRITLSLCILMTIHEKLRSSRNTKASKEATVAYSRGPQDHVVQKASKGPRALSSQNTTKTSTAFTKASSTRFESSAFLRSGLSSVQPFSFARSQRSHPSQQSVRSNRAVNVNPDAVTKLTE
ncbi:hypothetical protein Poli38472_013351 [Pythium oligandrum]|uniref:Uncharacterized protein n=1 Tax=Pythium oligandrum TaxID=41045 RepID=A0A8K1C7B7_PYTOL|nr:hypothetical protein Poli38472_013351 [Pythium oligandrum]|eukprot:TMW57877.1 hypothetical protein Poli38472_013351 [Pythium oligandrum]